MSTEPSSSARGAVEHALAELAAWWSRVDRGWRAVAVASIVTLIVQTGLPVPY